MWPRANGRKPGLVSTRYLGCRHRCCRSPDSGHPCRVSFVEKEKLDVRATALSKTLAPFPIRPQPPFGGWWDSNPQISMSFWCLYASVRARLAPNTVQSIWILVKKSDTSLSEMVKVP